MRKRKFAFETYWPLPGHPDKNLSAKQQLHAQKQNEEKVIELMPKNCLIKINQKPTIFLFRRLKPVWKTLTPS